MFDENLLPFIASINPTIMWIALTVGLLIFVIGYFAGGKLTMGRIGTCILMIVILGTLSLPVPMKLYSLVQRGLNIKVVFESSETAPSDKTKTPAKPNNTSTSSITSPETSNTEVTTRTTVPVSLQLVAFLLYLVWIAFLTGMSIFLYETLTVTAEEAEKR